VPSDFRPKRVVESLDESRTAFPTAQGSVTADRTGERRHRAPRRLGATPATPRYQRRPLLPPAVAVAHANASAVRAGAEAGSGKLRHCGGPPAAVGFRVCQHATPIARTQTRVFGAIANPTSSFRRCAFTSTSFGSSVRYKTYAACRPPEDVRGTPLEQRSSIACRERRAVYEPKLLNPVDRVRPSATRSSQCLTGPA